MPHVQSDFGHKKKPGCFPTSQENHEPYTLQLPSRSLTAKAPEKLPKPNRKPDRLPFPAFFRGKLAVKLQGRNRKIHGC